jgi:putative addiction module killer protein
MKRVTYLRLPNGREPFREWLEGRSLKERMRIRSYIERVALGGGKKSLKPVGEGIFEIKINYGPGIRLYFAEKGNELIILIVAGDKGNQDRDITLAKSYWRQYVS